MQLIRPTLQLPPGLQVCTTTRVGGVSSGGWSSFNLADHVGDAQEAVQRNRKHLLNGLDLPADPVWLSQLHGTDVVEWTENRPDSSPAADAIWSTHRDAVCAVMTADCLPIAIWSDNGAVIAAVHAGWRGLVDGIVQSTLAQLPCEHERLSAWIGPAIGMEAFEVGAEVAEKIREAEGCRLEKHIRAGGNGKYHVDLSGIATSLLKSRGLRNVEQSAICNFSDSSRFFSYRRERVCGRMATLIWRRQLNETSGDESEISP